jgi:hypothetical protein
VSAKHLGIALFTFLVVAGRQQAQEVRGVIIKVDPERKVLVLEGKNKGFKGEILHLKVRDDTEILIGRKPAKLSDLSSLRRVRVLFEPQGDELVAIRISGINLGQLLSTLSALSTERPGPADTVTQKAPEDVGPISGILRRVALTDREITLVRPGPSPNSEIETTLSVPQDVKVLRGQRPTRFEELKEGDQVSVTSEKRDGKLWAKSIEVGR